MSQNKIPEEQNTPLGLREEWNRYFGEAPDGTSKAIKRDEIADYWLARMSEQRTALIEGVEITEDTSDGYHTFKELYEFRTLYNAALFNEWAKQGIYNVHKSQRHFEGELCFGRNDYFVVVATLPTGQISNHYPMTDWDLFQIPFVEKALAQWDGHTSQDVAQRLKKLLETSNMGI